MGIDFNNMGQNLVSQQQLVNRQNSPVESIPDRTHVLPNNFKTRTMRSFQQVTSAFTEYPAKGFKGDKKSSFYEFLQMGTVPYLVGSAMFMGIFNGASKYFPNFNKKGSRALGNKLALGVVFYGLAKNLSKSFITTPVKMATGIDTEMPYEKISYTCPETPGGYPTAQYEQHNVMESHDFPRFDLLYDLKKDKPRNYYYDRIAEKNGLGRNLEASDAEVKPMIKDVISRSNTAKSLSTYMWGAVGVMLAAQPSWTNFFNAASSKSWTKFKSNPAENKFINAIDKSTNVLKNTWRITKSFGRNFVKTSKELYKGPEFEVGFRKHAGKIFLGVAAGLSVLGAINTIYGAKTSGDRKFVIDSNKKVTVD